MSLLLFDILIILMLFVKRKVAKGISPFLVMSLPYLALANINNLAMVNIYKYYPVSDLALGYILLFLFIIFFIEMVFSLLFRNKEIERNNLKGSKIKISNFKIVEILFYVGLVAYFISFGINVLRYGINGIKGMNGGILGHISFLFKILSPIYLDYKIKKKQIKRGVFFIIVGFAISLLFGGKYGIFVNILYMILYYLLKKKRSPKKITLLFLAFGIFGILVFMFLYAVVPMITHSYGRGATMQTSINFAIEHLFSYVCHPLIASDYAFRNVSVDCSNIPFTVIINIFKAALGQKDYVDPIYSFVYPVMSNRNTNVAGLFGELHYCLGNGSYAFIILTFIGVEWFWFYSKNKNKYFLTRCFYISILSLMFFCNFYTVSGMILPLIYLFVLESILQVVPAEKKVKVRRKRVIVKKLVVLENGVGD